jgi:ketosteroid isomerase-like protein
MKKKISIFILLIVLASSFKYRAKTVELDTLPASVKVSAVSNLKSNADQEFETVIDQMQKANLEFSQGNPFLLKSLWSHGEDVTAFGGFGRTKIKGWELVERRINGISEMMPENNAYSFDKITSKMDGNMAYLLQSEHYTTAPGVSTDFLVTVLFRKEKDGWKIVHRQADDLSVKQIAQAR